MNTVIALFEEQVKCTPDKIALWHNGEALSYQQLNQRANQLAHYLQFIGIQAEQLIGICLPRSVDLLVGVLGVLKAGAAYVPFDPSYPEQRLAYMLEDSQLKCLLSTEETRHLIPDTHYRRIDLNQEAAYIRQQPTDNLLLPITLSHLAYCLYTSGSTGLPKAVLMEHRGIANLITWHLQHRLTPARQLQFSPVSFDISAQEIFATWCSGGCLFSIAENLRRDPVALLDFINTHQIEKLYLPFTPLQQLAFVAHDAGKYPVSVREVITAGEKLQITREIKAFFQHTQAVLHNHYGMTECQDVTALTLTGSPESWALLPSIGKAIDNLQTYVLDEAGQAVAEGETGELFIGGYGLARGYLGRPELSAEKFIEVDLFGKRERVYKTGDLARWLPDGNLDCLGRIDSQVKLRGFRIELGEIEAVLRQHSAIKEAVVTLYEADGNKRLVAYLTLNDENLVIEDLRQWLKTRLLEYMLPSAFIVLNALPVNANGKIDHKALPAPELTAAVDFLPPVTPTEELLATLWVGLLKCNAVSREDNFFELGGHSLLATQLVTRIRDAFHVELPILAIFEHPQLSNLATAIEAAFGSICLPAIELQAADSPKVLSYAQQRLWFLNQLANNHSASYNEPYTLRLSGHLSIEALQQSLHWLVERHASLRSYFPTHEGQGQVKLHAIDSMEVLRIHDLRQLAADAQQQEVQSLSHHHALTPFDLGQDALFKADLLRLDENQSVLLLNMHHIITDGWSIGVFMRDWQQAYSAFVQGKKPSLPPLKIQYSDYAAWQRQWLQGDILQRQVDYWTKQLAGIPELLELPTDKPRPPRQSYQGARYSRTLSSELTQAVMQLSRVQNATIFMSLLSAFAVLLSRYSRQEDICIGSPIANRAHSHTEDLIGFFVNTLVLRSQIEPQQSFIQLLQTTRQTCLEAYTHQDIPFEILVEQLQLARSLSHSPLFQVMFALQNNQAIELSLPELEIKTLEVHTAIAKFDLTLNIEESNGQLECFWEYATDLFLPETIKRMAQHFEVLLTAIVENPEQSICQLSMLTVEEIAQLQLWNNTQTDYYHDKTVLDLFEQQVEKTPDNLAVIFKNQTLTYRQLNEKANQLAHFLLNLKTEEGSALLTGNPLIAIAVERSLEMMISLWAILKTGAAYVPIAPDYPAERICYLLEDSRATLLLTQSRLQSVLTEFSPHCVVLNLDEIDVAPYANKNPRLTIHPEDLAYVIYTSGSTGQPKGVLIEQRQLFSSTLARLNYYPSDSQTRLLSLPSFAFDAFGAGAYLTLMTGGSLHLPQNAADVEQLANTINSEKITHLVGTPTLYQELLRQIPSALTCLRCIIIGGEAASSTLLQEHFSKMPQAGLFNEYGPTEATIWSTVFRYQAAGQATNIIGKPIANTRIYILNKHIQAQPLNIPDELCIAGDGLARGYLNQPELTAEKFPTVELFGKTERIYKTGDLARWLPDGTLEFLGRVDNQIKLRGFRIELGEIESLLNQHPAVKEAVVILYEADGNKRLLAYVTVSQDTLAVDELRSWLKTRVPDYMIPAQFMVLDKLPITPNGKIDRKALPSPEAGLMNVYEAPRNTTEQQLVDIWSALFNQQTIGIHDNFFGLGGNSILSIQMVARCQQAGLQFTPRDLFEQQTIAELAGVLSKTQAVETAPVPRTDNTNLPLSFGQYRMWLKQSAYPDQATFNLSDCFRLTGKLDKAALQHSLNEIIRRHEILRTVFPVQNGNPVQFILPVIPATIVFKDFSDLPENSQMNTAENWARARMRCHFDFVNGPLLHIYLMQLARESHLLLFNVHHLITDMMSQGILMNELLRLYSATVAGKPSPLPDLPIQFADYALWQRLTLTDEALEKRLNYWRTWLAKGEPPVLALPTDRVRVMPKSLEAGIEMYQLPAELLKEIKKLSQRTGVTLYSIFLTALSALLGNYSDCDDIVIASPVANRNHSTFEPLIGLIGSMLLLRIDLSGKPSFSALLTEVQQRVLAAIAHQDQPFEEAIKILQPDRQRNTPVARVMLNFLPESPNKSLHLPELTLSPLLLDEATMNLDLVLAFWEEDGGLNGWWRYRKDIFDAETIVRIHQNFLSVLQTMVTAPQQSVAHLYLKMEE